MIYKTPLFKPTEGEEESKPTIGIEDLQPNVAKRIMNSITPIDLKLPELDDFLDMLEFPELEELPEFEMPELSPYEYPQLNFPTGKYPGLNYWGSDPSNPGLNGMLSGVTNPRGLNTLYSALKYLLQRATSASNVEIITHGWFQSERRQYPVDQDYISYNQNIIWDEVRFKQKFESKGSVGSIFSDYAVHYGSTGLSGSYNNATGYHRVFIFDVAGASGVSATPLPDKIISMCELGDYSLNVTYGGTGNVGNIPIAQSEIYGSAGNPIRNLTYFSTALYSCLATFNLSDYPVSINAEIIIPTRPVTEPESGGGSGGSSGGSSGGGANSGGENENSGGINGGGNASVINPGGNE